MVDVYGELFCGSRFCHAGVVDQTRLLHGVDVVGQRQRDDVRF